MSSSCHPISSLASQILQKFSRTGPSCICYHHSVSVEFKQMLNYRNCLTVIGGMTDNKFILMTDVALDSRLLWFESTTTENAKNWAPCLWQSYKQKDTNESKQSLRFQFSLCLCSYDLQRIPMKDCIRIPGYATTLSVCVLWVKFSSNFILT